MCLPFSDGHCVVLYRKKHPAAPKAESSSAAPFHVQARFAKPKDSLLAFANMATLKVAKDGMDPEAPLFTDVQGSFSGIQTSNARLYSNTCISQPIFCDC